jgi:hypothetical protein
MISTSFGKKLEKGTLSDPPGSLSIFLSSFHNGCFNKKPIATEAHLSYIQ